MDIIPPSQWILANYQDMGFSRDLIIQAWYQCQGSQHLLLNTLLRLSPRQAYIQQISQNPRMKRIPNSVLIKKMPRIKHVHLRFEGKDALEYLELRKLGLFSKKAFKDARSLTLEYIMEQQLKNGHIKILANHMNRGLRKLKHFSIQLDTERAEWQIRNLNIIPLLNSMKQSFVSLTSLRLSLRNDLRFSIFECNSFDRLFAKIRATLKHLSLDFIGEEYGDLTDAFETLGMVIMNRLHKLETLCLDFSQINKSSRIVRLLMVGACTHLTNLKSLDLRIDGYYLADDDDWSLYIAQDLKSDLQDLKLDFGWCRDKNLHCLRMLQNDILTLYPKLQRLFISALNPYTSSHQFYANLETNFLQKLNLKWFKLLYSKYLENRFERHHENQLLEEEQTMQMENKVAKIKQRARGEEELDLYLKALLEEEQAPGKYKSTKQEYFQNKLPVEDVETKSELEEQDCLDYMIEIFDGNIQEAHVCLDNCLFDDPFEYEYSPDI